MDDFKTKLAKFFKAIFPQKSDTKQKTIQKIAFLVACVVLIAAIVVITVVICINPSNKGDEPESTTSSEFSYVPSSKNHSTIGDTESGLNELVASMLASSEAAQKALEEEARKKEEESVKQVNETGSASVPVLPKEMPADYLPKFQKWYNGNTDIKGYLNIPGTNVNYPVVQGSNNTFYLDHNEYKQKYAWGIPYIDFRVTVSPNGNSKNIMIYGHGDDKRGLMLSNMKGYRKVEYYKQHPVLQFDTVYEESQWKVITMFIEDTNPSRGSDVFPFWNCINIFSEAEFDSYISNVKSRAFFDSGVDVNSSDQLLSIQVCEDTNLNNYNRLVLVARKLRPDESATVDTSVATQLK